MSEKAYKPIDPEEIQDINVRNIITGLTWHIMGKPKKNSAEEFEETKLCGVCYYPFRIKGNIRPAICPNEDCKQLIDWS
jgi:hypothetical protein